MSRLSRKAADCINNRSQSRPVAEPLFMDTARAGKRLGPGFLLKARISTSALFHLRAKLVGVEDAGAHAGG
jgi:hypothetical protein